MPDKIHRFCQLCAATRWRAMGKKLSPNGQPRVNGLRFSCGLRSNSKPCDAHHAGRSNANARRVSAMSNSRLSLYQTEQKYGTPPDRPAERGVNDDPVSREIYSAHHRTHQTEEAEPAPDTTPTSRVSDDFEIEIPAGTHPSLVQQRIGREINAHKDWSLHHTKPRQEIVEEQKRVITRLSLAMMAVVSFAVSPVLFFGYRYLESLAFPEERIFKRKRYVDDE
eukprot:Selendium_serpulae@DN10247_c0_g1_i1.p1